MDFICEICGAEFYYKKYLNRHQKHKHGMAPIKVTGDFSCQICDKLFPSKQSVKKHAYDVHNIKKMSINCQEDGCDQKFATLNEFRKHLGSHHRIVDIEVCQNLEFVKYEDFKEWLVEEERKTNSKYTCTSASSRKNDLKYMIFSCNRSGVYKPIIGDRKRQLKAQGTCKLGFRCTSDIRVKQSDSKISVSYYKKHYRHSCDFSHIPIPTVDKEMIAGKLLQGVEKQRILNDIRKSVDGKIERKHLITRKDVNNIQQQFSIVLNNEGSVINNGDLDRRELLKRALASCTAMIDSLTNLDESKTTQALEIINSLNCVLKRPAPTSFRGSNNSEPLEKKIIIQQHFH